MNQKDMNENLGYDWKNKQVGGFYQDTWARGEPDTAVYSPEWFYDILGRDDKVDSSSLLGVFAHEDMHATGLKEGGRSGYGSIGHKESKQHVLDNTRMMESSQKAFDEIINDLFKEKQSMIGPTPENEQGVSNFSFYEETAKTLQKWLESENLDIDYRKEPYIPFDISIGDTISGEGRWQSYDRLKNKSAK
jgi:hypothetical protein